MSYDAAFLNQITDPDFTYLNDEISKVKDAQSREALLQKAYDAAKQKAAESEEAYGQAKLENVRTLAELAVAQTTYDKYLDGTESAGSSCPGKRLMKNREKRQKKYDRYSSRKMPQISTITAKSLRKLCRLRPETKQMQEECWQLQVLPE